MLGRTGKILPLELQAFLERNDLMMSAEGSPGGGGGSIISNIARYVHKQLALGDFRGVTEFHQLDIDGTGRLDAGEFRAALQAIGVVLHHHEFQLLVHVSMAAPKRLLQQRASTRSELVAL
jgi:hypothetical protein